MVVKKIVSHLPPRHLDDFLAISILKYLYPDATIEYIYPQNVPSEYLNDSGIILIDVGNSYDPNLNNFDHHQDLNINSSIILVLKKFFPEININNSALHAIDIIDRFGFPRAESEGLVKKDSLLVKRIKTILRIEPNEEIGRIILNLLSQDLDYSKFVERLYEELMAKGLTQKAQEEIEEEEKIYEEKLKNIEYLNLDYKGKTLKITISNQSLSTFHSRFFEEKEDIDILIERNSMNEENTSIIVNSNSKNMQVAMDFADDVLAKNFTLIFRHKTGSIRVISEDIQIFKNYIRNNFKL
ncbi:MAG: MYG1 family protein [candidate division WOR-3 bacterium]|nr:MYG1 family protein [candidate division WOR-3 bacterium]MDW8150112.1 MYG1 family protein [candidate division WOR-3 bacterium]